MAKHVGIVGCSAEGAALCYKTLCVEAAEFMGDYCHPDVSMHTHCLGEYMHPIQTSDWQAVAELMLSSTNKLADIGADFAICPDNTIHEAFEHVREASPILWLHIAEVVAQQAQKKGYTKLLITGTKYLMTGPVYPDMLAKYNIDCCIPDEREREAIDNIIFSDLVNGIFTEKSRLYFNEIIQKYKAENCDAVVLGCTEIPLLVDPNDCPLPTLDSTRLLARAAIQEALQ